MASNAYVFQTNWHFDAAIEEVAAILEDVESLGRWWPSVYLAVEVLEPGAEGGIGKRVKLFTKGWLPYTLRWNFTVTESNSPHGFTIVADGDFVGQGVWTLAQKGPTTTVVFDWLIEADKPLLRTLSFLLKPVFEANHRWAMERGSESLELEIRRRRGEANVQDPPKATWPHRSARA
jgi:hypothetical protein